jgi:hypothetical protein
VRIRSPSWCAWRWPPASRRKRRFDRHFCATDASRRSPLEPRCGKPQFLTAIGGCSPQVARLSFAPCRLAELLCLSTCFDFSFGPSYWPILPLGNSGSARRTNPTASGRNRLTIRASTGFVHGRIVFEDGLVDFSARTVIVSTRESHE